MDSTSSDEEDDQLEWWNNWLPDTEEPVEVPNKSSGSKVGRSMEAASDFSWANAAEKSGFGNWIPPLSFSNLSVRGWQEIPTPKINQQQFVKDVGSMAICMSTESTLRTTKWRKEVNLDWGKRIQLHNATNFNENDVFWGVVHLGVFGNIQLWVNEYGHLCCSACGKISKTGSSEITYISINNSEILRKVLTISSGQWASLCEIVKETKTVLKFNAFEDCDLRKKSSLERLWFFICKRRHFLPGQYMLLKFCGAVKSMRKLDITPKLLVQDIRYIE